MDVLYTVEELWVKFPRAFKTAFESQKKRNKKLGERLGMRKERHFLDFATGYEYRYSEDGQKVWIRQYK